MVYLVTGGAGFIGSHLAEKLLKDDKEVIILDNFDSYYDPAVKHQNIQRIQHFNNLTFVEGDIRNITLLDDVFEKYSITHIAHLAGMGGVRYSIENTRLYMEVNTIGSMNLLENARKYEIKQFVFASTGSVYGKTSEVPFVETDNADRPLAAYPASKRSVELLGHTYHNLFGMQFTAVRFFNVYGPFGRPDMMPLRLMHATQDGAVIPLFNGGDIHRDWTYIDDTVDGVIRALDRPLGYEIINLGYGSTISLNDFVGIIQECSGKKINTKEVDTPLSDPPITYCDNTKAKRLLGFDPKANVQTGLNYTWDWFQQNMIKS